MNGPTGKGGMKDQYLSGRNAVREALSGPESGDSQSRYNKVLISQSATSDFAGEIRSLARSINVPVQVVPHKKLDRLIPGVNHQGVAISLSPMAYLSVHDLLTRVAPTHADVQNRKPILLILDRIQDPHNLGAILRTAAALGIAGVVLPERDAAPVNEAAMKSSAGTAQRIPVARATNLSTVIEGLKERGYWIVGATANAEMSVWDMEWDRPIAIVIGSEDTGMKLNIERKCDFLISIPLGGEVESLNASVAAGIVMAAAARSRVERPGKDTPR